MLYEAKIRLNKAFLGSQCTRDKIRRFHKTKSGEIIIDTDRWSWALREAAISLRLDKTVDLDCIRFEEGFRSPTLSLYVRKWHERGKQREEMFESIRENTILTFDILITSVYTEQGLNAKQPPDAEQFTALMNFVGKMIGLSPWGSKFGFGRFQVESLKEK